MSSEYRILIPLPGDDINDFASDMRHQADRDKARVYGEFNDVLLKAEPGTLAKFIVGDYHEACQKRSELRQKAEHPLLVVQEQPTKREWLAGLAMQGMLPCQAKREGWHKEMAETAVKCADALLDALSKTGGAE